MENRKPHQKENDQSLISIIDPLKSKGLKGTKRVPRQFYERSALEVAPDLLGLMLVHETNQGVTAGLITETEAYVGPEDKASHAYNFRRTRRNEAMYGQPGTAYVYFIYGMHYCFNVVVEAEGLPHAILIRSIEPLLGEDIMLERRKGKLPLASGPARLCQAMAIGREQNQADLVTGDLYIATPPDLGIIRNQFEIEKTPRIGIDYADEAKDFLWRFVLTPRK